MKKIVVIIIILTLISKILAFLGEISLAYFFGTSSQTDAFLVAFSIPTIIFELISSGILNGYIPIYNQIRENQLDNDTQKFTNNFINITLIITLFIFVLLFLFSPYLVKLFSLGFNQETLKITTFYTEILLFSIFPIILFSIFSGYLQVKQKFITVTLANIPPNLMYVIAVYLAYKSNNFTLLVYISSLIVFVQFIFLIPSIIKSKYKYSFHMNLKDKNLYNLLRLSIPIIVGTSLEQINLLIDRTMASKLGIGTITILNYSNRLNVAIYSLSIGAVLNILFPKLSLLVAENKRDELKQEIKYSINMIFIFSVPIMFGIILLSNDIIKFVFGKGNLNNETITTIAKCFIGYSICFVALCLRNLAIKIFYSFREARIPTINSAIGIFLNIIFNIIFSNLFGIVGIAIATSLSTIVMTVSLFLKLKKYEVFFQKSNYIVFYKVIVSCIVMTISIVISKKIFISSDFINLFFHIFIGGGCYILSILLMKINEIRDLFHFFLILKKKKI